VSSDPLARAAGPSVTVDRFARQGAVVRVTGEADLALGPALGGAIADQIAAGRRRIAIDLSGATFIDCSTVELVLDALAPLLDDGEARIVLAGATGPVRRVLDLLEVGRMIEVVPEVPWAARSLRATPLGSFAPAELAARDAAAS
jgi:anti-anti-sigma factor